ncbi:MAG: TraB/GumN family protein [Prevotella sp.]|nr:TraB/GumN family protein [Prevotella sp.]
MKRNFVILIFSLVAVLGTQAQLLYKVSGNGLQKPSYLIGTHHLAKSSHIHQISGLKEALEACEQIYGEIVMEEMTNPENLQMVQEAMMMPQGKTLRSLLSPLELVQLNAFLKNLMGVDFTHPAVAQQFDALTPQALVTQFQVLIFMKNHPEDFDPNNQYDTYFQTYAKQNGKPVGGLETLEEQINILYKGYSLERQKELLVCLVQHADFMDNILIELTRAFYSQDIGKMQAIFEEKIGNSCDSTPAEDALLIYNRNANWMKKVPHVMAEKSTLFAVGTAHLWGEKGMLQLLRNAGYQVEAVK